jgi:hypothetical protein
VLACTLGKGKKDQREMAVEVNGDVLLSAVMFGIIWCQRSSAQLGLQEHQLEVLGLIFDGMNFMSR